MSRETLPAQKSARRGETVAADDCLERLVLSEVHVGRSALDDEEAELVSRYRYLTPTSCVNEDDSSSSSDSEDDKCRGVRRHRKRPRHESAQRRSRPSHEVLTIVHKMATTLGLVGQQVWSAAFLLGDFVLTHEEVFAGMQVLELGAGPGVVGLIAARVAKKCYLTDYHTEVLKLLARNVEANRHLFRRERWPIPDIANARRDDGGRERDVPVESGTLCSGVRSDGGDRSGDCVAAVRELDWFTISAQEGRRLDRSFRMCDPVEGDQITAILIEEGCEAIASGENNSNDGGTCPFAWRKDELEGLWMKSTAQGGGRLVIVAADVVYDEGLTDALFNALKLLMPATSVHARANRGDKLADDGKCEDSFLRRANGGGVPDQTLPSTTATPTGVDSASSDEPVDSKTAEDKHGCSRANRSGGAVLYLALEKRFNFSMAELSVAATGYGALLRNVLDITGAHEGGFGVDGCAQPALKDGTRVFEFEGKRLPLSFQQCFVYQRSKAMELWEIRRRSVQREDS